MQLVASKSYKAENEKPRPKVTKSKIGSRKYVTRGKLLAKIATGMIRRSGQLQEEFPSCAHFFQTLMLPLSLLVGDVPGFTQKALGLAAW